MKRTLWRFYDALVIRRPLRVLFALGLLLLVAASGLPQSRFEVSADSLVLEGDQALDYYREARLRYPEPSFLLVAFRPREGSLLDDANLARLTLLRDDLAGVPGVLGVRSLLDVPLLSAGGSGLAALARGGFRTLEDPTTDREQARAEFMNSPIYSGLVADAALQTAALQVLLKENPTDALLLKEREDLRRLKRRGSLDVLDRRRLRDVEESYRERQATAELQRRQAVAGVRGVLTQHRGDAEIYLGGVPMIAADMVAFVQSDIVIFGGAIALFILGLLSFLFRRPRWVLLPLLVCSATLLSTLGLFAFLGWSLTVVSANLVALLLIFALSISVHLIVRYRETCARSPGVSQEDLVRDTVRFMGRPCLFMALTTAVSFCSLLFSGVRPIIDFGWMMAVGTAAALVWAFLLLPSCLCLLGRGAEEPASRTDPARAFTRRFAVLVEHRGAWITGATLFLVVIVLAGIPRLQVENRFIDYFDKDTEIYRGMEIIDRDLGGTIPLEVVLRAPRTAAAEAAGSFDDFGDDFGEEPDPWFSRAGLNRIEQVHDYLASLPQSGKVLSLATSWKQLRSLLGHTPNDLELALLQTGLPEEVRAVLVEPYLSAPERETRIVLRVKETRRDLNHSRYLEEVRRHLVEELNFAPEDVHLSGLMVLYRNMLHSLYRSQVLTLGTVFLAILLMFLVLFRSLPLALLALAPNVLAAGLVLGSMGLAGLPLDLMNVTIAAIVLGVGVDNTIHYLWRFRWEFSRDRNYLAAIYRCHGSIGRAMYYTSVTVIAGFSILALSNFRPSVYFGLLTALAMAAALLGALLLLPQLLRRFRPFGPELPE